MGARSEDALFAVIKAVPDPYLLITLAVRTPLGLVLTDIIDGTLLVLRIPSRIRRFRDSMSFKTLIPYLWCCPYRTSSGDIHFVLQQAHRLVAHT